MTRVLLIIAFFLTPISPFSAQTRQSGAPEDSGSPFKRQTELFNDDAVSGEVSFTHGTNIGHSVMAFGPNAHMSFEGPAPLDPNYSFGMLAIESNWIDDAGKIWDEFYFTTQGGRVLIGGRNATDGTAGIAVRGSLYVDGTQPGLRNPEYNPTVAIFDDQTSYATISVTNLNPTSKGAQLILGSTFFDATGWSLQQDPGQNGAQAFAILDRSSYTFPFQIDDAGRISLGFTSLHTATKSVEFSDPKGVRESLGVCAKYKTSDLGRGNATALVDPDLAITLEPGIWKVKADLFFTVSGGNPGFRAYFDTSGGSVSQSWSRWTFPDSAGGTSAKTYTYRMLGSTTGAFESIGPATGTGGYFVKGEALVTVTSTTSLDVMWAQSSSQASRTTTLLAPSCIVATKID